MRFVIEIDNGELAASGCYLSAVTITFAPPSEGAERPVVPAAAPRVAVEVESAAPAMPVTVGGAPAVERGGTDAGPAPARPAPPSRAVPTAPTARPAAAPPPYQDAGAAAAPRSLRIEAGAGPMPFVGAPPAVAAMMPAQTTSAPVADLPSDDLTVIRGIGPAIADVLAHAGVATYAQLAASRPDRLQRVLTNAQLVARVQSWPEQGKLAAEGDLEGLRALQAQLK